MAHLKSNVPLVQAACDAAESLALEDEFTEDDTDALDALVFPAEADYRDEVPVGDGFTESVHVGRVDALGAVAYVDGLRAGQAAALVGQYRRTVR